MSAQPGFTPSAVAPKRVSDGRVAVYAHGAMSGIVGAAMIALWFFYLDVTRGHLLYTPTVLGRILFYGGAGLASPETMQTSVRITLMFALVHGAVFIVMGMAAARLLDLLEHRVNVLLAAVLLFVILGFAFSAFALTFSGRAFEVLPLPDVILGNALAATAMVAHLWRARPRDEETQSAE